MHSATLASAMLTYFRFSLKQLFATCVMSQPLIIANSVTLNFRARVCNVKMTFTLTAFQTYVLPALQLLQEQMDALDASSMDVRNA